MRKKHLQTFRNSQKQNSEDKHPDLTYLAEKWPSALVARTSVEDFTGGLINKGTLANLDAKGEGPEGSIRVGHKVAYPVIPFVRWLQSRARIIRKKP